MALKDGWLDEGSRTEGENQAAIFARLEGVQETDYAWAPEELQKSLGDTLRDQRFKDYFMEIVESRKLTTTKSYLVVAKMPIGSENVLETPVQGKNLSALPSSHQSTISQQSLKSSLSCEHRVKYQYRFIYRDIGFPLHDAEDTKTSFLAISDTCIGMYARICCVLMMLTSLLKRLFFYTLLDGRTVTLDRQHHCR